MKTFNKFLALAIVALFVCACGKDDKPTLHTKELAKTWSTSIDGSANKTITSTLSITLNDVLSSDQLKEFVSGEFQNSGSYIKIRSERAIPLSKLTLKIGSATYTTTDFIPNQERKSNDVVAFLSKVFEAYKTKNKTAKVDIEYITTDNININEMFLDICINGEYKWNTFD